MSEAFDIFVQTEDGNRTPVHCTANTTIKQIKNEFAAKYPPADFRICFDGKSVIGDDDMLIISYKVCPGDCVFLRNKSVCAPKNVELERAASVSSGNAYTRLSIIEPKPTVDVDHSDSRTRVDKLRAFISHFLKRRPHASDLVDANIIDSAPAAQLVPPSLDVVKRVTAWVEKNAMTSEGLFRVSGIKAENEGFADEFVRGIVSFENKSAEDVNPNSVCTGFKIYLRERAEPLIPYNYYKTYRESTPAGLKDLDEIINKTQALLAALPANSQMILLHLSKFLARVSLQADANKMHSRNLGVVFAPTIMRSESAGMDSLADCEPQIQLVENLIVYSDRFTFGGSASVPAMSISSACGSASEHKRPVLTEEVVNMLKTGKKVSNKATDLINGSPTESFGAVPQETSIQSQFMERSSREVPGPSGRKSSSLYPTSPAGIVPTRKAPLPPANPPPPKAKPAPVNKPLPGAAGVCRQPSASNASTKPLPMSNVAARRPSTPASTATAPLSTSGDLGPMKPVPPAMSLSQTRALPPPSQLVALSSSTPGVFAYSARADVAKALSAATEGTYALLEKTSGGTTQCELLFRSTRSEEPVVVTILHKPTGWYLAPFSQAYLHIDDILAPLKESGSICRPLAPGDLQEKQPKKKQQAGGSAGGSTLAQTLADALDRKNDYSAMAAAAKQLSEQLSDSTGGNADELKDVGEFVMAFGLCVANKIKH